MEIDLALSLICLLFFRQILLGCHLILSFWHEVCMKQETIECSDFWHEVSMKRSAVNLCFSHNFSNFCLQSLTSWLLNFLDSLGQSLIILQNLPTFSCRPSLIKQTECTLTQESYVGISIGCTQGGAVSRKMCDLAFFQLCQNFLLIPMLTYQKILFAGNTRDIYG